jgi:2-C-methyl-D-erythritol 4-phosphate cytidylyltransferase
MQESVAAVIVDFPSGGVDKHKTPTSSLRGKRCRVRAILAGGQVMRARAPASAPHYPLPLHLAWTPLAGRIILARTVNVFEASPQIESIVLVLAAEHIADADKLCRSEGWHKVVAIVASSSSRQASVLNGLGALAEKAPAIVMIHDAARPLVTQTLLETGMRATQEHQAATAAVPVKDTIKQVQQGQITATLDRAQLWTIQTPQIFSYPLLHQTHRQAAAQHLQDSIDDADLLEQLGQPVIIFPGSYTNIKISTAEDLLLAEALLQEDL